VVVLAAMLCAASVLRAQSLDDAVALHAAGRFAEALESYRSVAEDLKTKNPAAAGMALNNACVILMNTGELREARMECQEALRLRRTLGDNLPIAKTLNNLGLVEQYLAEYESAERHFGEALTLNQALDDVQSQAINLANLGVLATQAGWYPRAIDFQQRAMELALRQPDAPWSDEQIRLARINQAVVLEKLGAYREALDLYELVSDDKDEMHPSRQAGLSLNLGVVYRNLGDPVRALREFEAAEATYDLLGDTAALSNVFLNVGLVTHLNLERPQEAEAAYREALRLAELSGDRSEEIRDLCYLGRFLLEMGRPDEAEPIFQRALGASEESGSAEGRWTSLEGLARIAASRGALEDALGGLREAMQEIEETRSTLDRSRGEFFGQKRPVYAAAIEVLHRLSLEEPGAGHEEEAFAVAQQAKARMLLDALGTGATGGKPLEASEVMARIRDGVLLEYFVGESELFLWVVNGESLNMRVLGPPQPILDAVTVTHRELSGGAEPPRSVLDELSRVLLPDLGGQPAIVGHLRIAPDRRLHYLPFELLSPPGSNGRLLVEMVDVSYLPSASALEWLDRPPSKTNLMVVGVGSPILRREASAGPDPVGLLVSRFDLGLLPAAADELGSLERWLPGDKEIRTGPKATEEEFRRLVASGPRIVHFASHAVIDERHGRGAAILLTPGNASDGLLYPSEIAALDYPVDLTVLAACRTALGPDGDGHALASLTGSFLAAGSSAVLATLWDVGDQETSAFMEQFYYHLRQGLPPMTALRKVKQSFLADPEWQDSHLWAAYVLVGEAGPVASRPVGRWWWFVLLGALVAAAAYGLLRGRFAS
jgi:tetratricopeptide (TPR) repeat protein